MDQLEYFRILNARPVSFEEDAVLNRLKRIYCSSHRSVKQLEAVMVRKWSNIKATEVEEATDGNIPKPTLPDATADKRPADERIGAWVKDFRECRSAFANRGPRQWHTRTDVLDM